jgi:hypothetical protein
MQNGNRQPFTNKNIQFQTQHAGCRTLRITAFHMWVKWCDVKECQTRNNTLKCAVWGSNSGVDEGSSFMGHDIVSIGKRLRCRANCRPRLWCTLSSLLGVPSTCKEQALRKHYLLPVHTAANPRRYWSLNLHAADASTTLTTKNVSFGDFLNEQQFP